MDKNQIKKPLTLFDHISGITDKKVPWDTLSDADKKSFSPYMIDRFLSMDIDYVELVNELQKYTIGILPTEMVYKLYYDILPKKKKYNKYIKGSIEAKYNENLVLLVSKHFSISLKEATEYIEIYYATRLDKLSDIIKKYGKTDAEIKSLLKIQK